MPATDPVMPYKRWKEFLWPIAGTILGLLVMPLAIAQYADFFNENRWLLPLSVLVTLLCWIAPFLVQENAKRFLVRAWSTRKLGKLSAICTILVCLLLLILGSRKLFLVHDAHLNRVLDTKTQLQPSPPPPSANPQDLSSVEKMLEEIKKNTATKRDGRLRISTAQMEAIKGVDQFIGEPDEITLRKEFGLPEMMDSNIRAIINNLKRYQRTGVNSHYPLPAGDTLIDGRFAKGHIRRHGGGFQMDVDDTTVYFILLSKDYVSSKSRLVKMTNSAELPSIVTQSLRNFDSVIQQDATHLIEVLSASMDKDHNLYLEYDNPNSPLFHQLDALYLDTFVQLRPEADKVRDAIRSYLRIN